MKKLYVIGDPISHSLSPLIQNTMIAELGIKYEYSARLVKSDETLAFLKTAMKENCAGFNATMPHKTILASAIDCLSEDAEICGAVNTVVLRGGSVRGYNTDGIGFLQSLIEKDMNPSGRCVCVLGAGGAARAVVLKLAAAGCKKIIVCNRTIEKAEALAEVFPDVIVPADFSPASLCESAKVCDLMINCTPVGMGKIGASFESFGFLDCLNPSVPVVDIIYNPAVTPLMAEAARRGHQTANGLGMLVWQAVYALERFTESSIDAERVVPKVYAALKSSGIG